MRIIILLAAPLLASPAAAQKLPGAVSGCGTTAIPKAEMSDAQKLASGAECFERVEVIADVAARTRRDRLALLTPPPMDHPMPSPAGGWEVSPSPAGVPAIASGVTVAPLIGPAWGTGQLPASAAPDVLGAFRFTCTPSHNAYDDPIVYPGQPGKSHLHTFFGNTKADAASTYASLRTSGDSTCTNVLNRSAYWIPAMMHPTGKVVMPDYVSIYYKQPPRGSQYCGKPWADRCAELPRGLRYIFGYNMIDLTRHDPAGARWFNCDGPRATPGHYTLIADAAKGCPAGTRLGAVISSPECWDGKHLDSPDHRSHMGYVEQDGFGRAVCPKTHPVRLPTFQLAAWYPSDGTVQEWKLASDIAMKTAGGVTMHADWFGAWEDSILARWAANCIDKALNCSGTDLGDGGQMRQVGRVEREGPALVDPPVR